MLACLLAAGPMAALRVHRAKPAPRVVAGDLRKVCLSCALNMGSSRALPVDRARDRFVRKSSDTGLKRIMAAHHRSDMAATLVDIADSKQNVSMVVLQSRPGSGLTGVGST